MRKKSIIIALFAFLLIVGIVGTFWGPSVVEARSIWNSCPRGEVNDPYPGDCHDYIDTNKDGICDRSQPEPAAAATVASTALVSSSIIPSSTAGVSSPDDEGTTSDGNAAAVSTDAGVLSDTSVTTTNANGDGTGSGSGSGTHKERTYYFIPVVAGFIVAYAITWILSNRKVFKVLTHRKIWNIVLLVSALVSAVLGIILILNLDFGTNILLPVNTLFWHVEAGLAMAVIAVFHIVWHWRYWIKMFQVKDPAK